MDALRLLVVAIDHGGYAAFTTQCTGGSLASPVARLGRQRQRIAHRISPKSLGLNIRPFHASRDDHEKGCAGVAEGSPVSQASRVFDPVQRNAFSVYASAGRNSRPPVAHLNRHRTLLATDRPREM